MGKLSTPSTTMSQPSMISMMLSAFRRVWYLMTSTSGFSARIVSSAEITLGTPCDRCVDHLALKVGKVHLVVIDDAQRAHPGGGQVQRGREPRPPAPSSSTRASSSFCCPSMPISGISRWRE